MGEADASTSELDPHVTRNLLVIEQQMIELLNRESFGGNASGFTINGKRYPCGAANFYANRTTGEIIVFGNSQDTPPEIVRNSSYVQSAFRVVYNTDKDGLRTLTETFSPIVDLVYDERMQDEARNRILETAKAYNKKYAPEINVDVASAKRK